MTASDWFGSASVAFACFCWGWNFGHARNMRMWLKTFTPPDNEHVQYLESQVSKQQESMRAMARELQKKQGII